MEQPPAARGTDAPSQFPRNGTRDLGPDDPSRRRAYDWPGPMSLGHSFQVGGDAQNRTGDGGFADLCLATWLRRRHVSEPDSTREVGAALLLAGRGRPGLS